MIFYMLMDPIDSNQHGPPGAIDPTISYHLMYQYLVVTQVCKRWRNIALRSVLLWSRIWSPPLPPRSIPRFLRNSAEALLELRFVLDVLPSVDVDNPGRYVKSPNALVLLPILKNMRRVKVLAMRITDVIHGYTGFSTQPAPELEELTIAHMVSDDRDLACGRLPDQLFAGNVPRLRKLILQNYQLQTVSIALLRNLTSLTVVMDNMRYTTPLGVMLQMLESCPTVEILEIHDLGIFEIPQGVHRRRGWFLQEIKRLPVVQLPRLHRLTLTAASAACYILLQRLIIPSNVTWDIHCRFAELYDDIDVWSVVPGAALICEELEIQFRCGFMVIKPLKRVDSGRSTTPDKHSGFESNLKISWSQFFLGVEKEFNTLHALVSRTTLRNVKDLYLSIEFCDHKIVMDARAWRLLFFAFPNLENLHILGGKIRTIAAHHKSFRCIVGCTLRELDPAAMVEVLTPTVNTERPFDERCLSARLRFMEFAVMAMESDGLHLFEELTSCFKQRAEYGAAEARWTVTECLMDAFSATSRQLFVDALSDQRRFWEEVLVHTVKKRIYSSETVTKVVDPK